MLAPPTKSCCNDANIANIANMRSVHTKLDEELAEALAEVEAKTRLSAADLTRQGLLRIVRELRESGKLEILPFHSAVEKAA